MTIGGFREITISGMNELLNFCLVNSFWFILSTENSELKNVLSSISGIPEENIEYAMVGLFFFS